MEKGYYEQMLLKNYHESSGAEEKWDARAKQFNLSQQKERGGFAGAVTEILQNRGILTGADVVDIGGGSGRYAIPFAAHAGHVTMTDISANMLELAKKNAERQGLHNLSYVKLEWESADLSALNWNRKFDLAFASMCPAVRCPKGLQNMSAVSRGYCLMNQFVTETDTLAAYLAKALDIQRSYNPHNDRDTVQAVFNLLWLEVYEPEICYLRQEEEAAYTVEEALERYSGRYEQTASGKGLSLKAMIEDYAEQGTVQISHKSTLAMILWKV